MCCGIFMCLRGLCWGGGRGPCSDSDSGSVFEDILRGVEGGGVVWWMSARRDAFEVVEECDERTQHRGAKTQS